MIIYLSTFLMISALVFPWYVISYYYEKRLKLYQDFYEEQDEMIEGLKERVRELEGK